MKISKYSFFKNILLFSLFFLFIFTLAKSYSDFIFSNISNNFLRLHIVANSDSTGYQLVKYQIRDSILNYISPYLKNAKNKQDAINTLNNNIDEFYKISEKILKENNLNYPIKISVGNFKFPTKDYSNFTLPEGNYDALKIELGSSSGQNWWCVMFPSLCFIDINNGIVEENSKSILEKGLSKESYAIVSDKSKSTIQFKFKILEFFGQKNISTAKN